MGGGVLGGGCPGEANLKAQGQARQGRAPGLPWEWLLASSLQSCQLRTLLLTQLPNEAGLWLLGQLIFRRLFVLHTLMLFNNNFF